MRYAIWAICFGLLFLFFLSAPSHSETKAEDMRVYCTAFAADYPEALQDDIMAACLFRLSGKGVEL